MHNPKQDPEERLKNNIEALKKKFEADGQDINVHLEGLLHTEYLKYWEYIKLETLLSLQAPRTSFPDEMIFITYHQITELYFKMVLHELNLLRDEQDPDNEFFKKRLTRINWYFGQLIESFDVISVGMAQDQFLKFRTSLTPASGFQSVQYRMVEIASTDFINLVSKDTRDSFSDYSTIEEMFEEIYWKKGAIDVATGKKTLTLRLFEEKYSKKLLRFAEKCQFRNLWSIYKKLPNAVQQDQDIIAAMKLFDGYVNINWPLAHYKYAVSFLVKSNKEPIDATGGTNWQKYLPPRFQKQVFFPSIYTEQELNDWGKNWVETEVLAKFS